MAMLVFLEKKLPGRAWESGSRFARSFVAAFFPVVPSGGTGPTAAPFPFPAAGAAAPGPRQEVRPALLRAQSPRSFPPLRCGRSASGLREPFSPLRCKKVSLRGPARAIEAPVTDKKSVTLTRRGGKAATAAGPAELCPFPSKRYWYVLPGHQYVRPDRAERNGKRAHFSLPYAGPGRQSWRGAGEAPRPPEAFTPAYNPSTAGAV